MRATARGRSRKAEAILQGMDWAFLVRLDRVRALRLLFRALGEFSSYQEATQDSLRRAVADPRLGLERAFSLGTASELIDLLQRLGSGEIAEDLIRRLGAATWQEDHACALLAALPEGLLGPRTTQVLASHDFLQRLGPELWHDLVTA